MSSSIFLMTKAKRIIQKRPLLSLTTTSITSLTSYAYYVEYQTNIRSHEYHHKLTGKGTINLKEKSSGTATRTTTNNDNEDVYDLPKDYDRNALATYWNHRPISVLKRLFTITNEVIPFTLSYFKDSYSHSLFSSASTSTSQQEEQQEKQKMQIFHACKLRNMLTRLGPAFVKLGQQLSIRPDILPAHVLFELQRLCDDVEPISDEVAKQVLMDELGDVIRIVNENNDDGGAVVDGENKNVIWIKDLKKVASASLGQVYKATRIKKSCNKSTTSKSNINNNTYHEEEIAIKIQRPEMKHKVSLDLYLLNNYGAFLDCVFDILTHQIPFHESFINCFANGSYNELDYIKEASNQSYLKKELAKRGIDDDVVYIPKVYSDLSSEKVLTMEWIEGIKLANASADDVQKLIPVGVELFLTQLLDIGFFHSDPHPGNLYVIHKKMDKDDDVGVGSGKGKGKNDGETSSSAKKKPILCLLDFGLCAEIDQQSRLAMTTAIVHLLNGDFNTLINKDAKELGFLPHDLDISNTDIQPILTKILRDGLLESKSNLVERKRNLMAISNELNQVFFEYPFSVPPFFALITRGLGLLEGIALSGDPNFDIFQASYPYASRRAAAIYGKHSLSWLKSSWMRMKRKTQRHFLKDVDGGAEEGESVTMHTSTTRMHTTIKK